MCYIFPVSSSNNWRNGFTVAKKTQSAKRHRQSLIRRERNYSYRARLRTMIKRARTAVLTGTEDREEQVAIACRELDRMVTKGVLHRNTASRRKSRLLEALHGKRNLTVPYVKRTGDARAK